MGIERSGFKGRVEGSAERMTKMENNGQNTEMEKKAEIDLYIQ